MQKAQGHALPVSQVLTDKQQQLMKNVHCKLTACMQLDELTC